MTSEQLTGDLHPFEASGWRSLKRSIAPAAYLTAAGVATLGWFYALGRCGWILIGWAFG
jgi:hypothetical protein